MARGILGIAVSTEIVWAPSMKWPTTNGALDQCFGPDHPEFLQHGIAPYSFDTLKNTSIPIEMNSPMPPRRRVASCNQGGNYRYDQLGQLILLYTIFVRAFGQSSDFLLQCWLLYLTNGIKTRDRFGVGGESAKQSVGEQAAQRLRPVPPSCGSAAPRGHFWPLLQRSTRGGC